MKRALAIAAVTFVLTLGSCMSQPVILPSRDFDRPTDMTFVCMETVGATAASAADGGAAETDASGSGGGAKILSGRPMRECHSRNAVDVPSADRHTFAFLPNSATGELSVIDADTWTLVNLDPANSGFNRLPIGVLPTQIAASDDGCRLVTANAGSCDLSFVNPAALLAPTIEQDQKPPVTPVTPAGTTIVTSVIPKGKNSLRELRVRAGEVAFLPMATTMLSGAANLCSGDPGHQWQALATFPSCDLVALIDLPSGVIQKAAYTRPTKDGSVTLVPLADGEDPVCPIDCGFPPAPDGSPPEVGAADAGAEAPAADGGDDALDALEPDASDAGASDASPEVAPPPIDPGDVPYVGPGTLLPGPIAIVPESGRAYVGLANAAFVVAFDVKPNTLTPASTGVAIPLHEGALGVNRVRLSIDPYKDKTTNDQPMGSFIGNQTFPDREYLYVVARDGTLRVVQVANLPETECETNLDFTLAVNQGLMSAACPPVTGAAVRRPGLIGPGIRLPSPVVDVAVADIRPDPADNSETSVTGTHAWVLSAAGSVFLVNIDPVLRHIFYVDYADAEATADMHPVKMCTPPDITDCQTEPPPPPNTLRNRNFMGYTPVFDSSSGPARLDVPPAQPTIGPRIETIWTQGTAANATALTADYLRTEVYFPDQVNVTPQTWTVTWQGPLMPNPRLTGQLRSDNTLVDLGLDFCRIGVEDTDIVTLVGCTADSQCGLNKKCVLGSNGAQGGGGLPITGLCLSPTIDRTKCDDLLSTVKRYDVTTAQAGVLQLAPHKDELILPALRPCMPVGADIGVGGADGGTDAGADADADAAGGGADGGPKKDPCQDPADPSTMNFQCSPDHRCLNPCSKENEAMGCRTGRICLHDPDKPLAQPKVKGSTEPCDNFECYCADAPPLNSPSGKADINTCLGELTSYQVGVGRGFTVTGSVTGLPATGVAGPDGRCTRMADLDPRVQTRISMDDPVCPPSLFASDTNPVTVDSRCDPNLSDPGCPIAAGNVPAAKSNSFKMLNILKTENVPNPCQYNGGPNETDPPNVTPMQALMQTHVKAMFRNRELHFGLTNLERPPSGIFQIRFDVHGGFQAQTVAIPPTVELTMPARIILGPFDAANYATSTMSEVPYLFVVDQRRLGRAQGGGPTRGQLLRIHPLGYAITTPVTGNQPWFEDLSHSANQFPIQ